MKNILMGQLSVKDQQAFFNKFLAMLKKPNHQIENQEQQQEKNKDQLQTKMRNQFKPQDIRKNKSKYKKRLLLNQDQKGHRDREEIIKKNEKKNLLQEERRLNSKLKHLEVCQLYIFHHSFFHQVPLVLLNLNYKSKQCENSTLNKLKMKL